MSPGHLEFLLSRAKQTDRDFCGKYTSCNHLSQRTGGAEGAKGQGKARGLCRDPGLSSAERPQGRSGTAGVPAAEGQGGGSPGLDGRPGRTARGTQRPRTQPSMPPPAAGAAAAPAVRGRRPPRAVTGPRPRPHSPCAALRAERVLHSRRVAFHGRSEENSLRLFLPPFSVAPICAPAPLPAARRPPPPEGRLPLPRPPRVCRCRAVAEQTRPRGRSLRPGGTGAHAQTAGCRPAEAARCCPALVPEARRCPWLL